MSTTALLYGFATNAARAFTGHNGQFTSGTVVHRVHHEPWVGGATVPAPACRVGNGGWLPWTLQPTLQPVTCGRCLRLAAVAVEPQRGDPQLALFS